MRRFLTLVCLLGLALPAGISISGCVRNPAGNYCNGLGYGPTVSQVYSITLQPQIAGISMAYGQTRTIAQPLAYNCKGGGADFALGSLVYGTTNNQLVDISPSGAICAGTWNRNTGGGIPDYTYCYYPNPLPSTGGLPYGIAYITAEVSSVTSNPVAVYVHAPVSSISLVATPVSSSSSSSISSSQGCYSQNQQAQLDAQGCFANNGQQYELCAPPSVDLTNPANFACPGHLTQGDTPNIIASGSFTAPALGAGGSITGTTYFSGGTITGAEGQTCAVSNFNNGSTGATATVQLTAANTVASGTPLIMSSGGTGATATPTEATLSNGTATCSGTVQLSPIVGSAGQFCYLTLFNNGSAGATATVNLTGTNTIASPGTNPIPSGTPLSITSGGMGATAPPTIATLTSGTASCSGTAAVATTLTPVPSCGSSIGTLSFSSGTSSVASINPTTNVITAEQPGTTAITATIAQSASSAGYFSTCPPKSISISLANGSTKGVIAQGFSQGLTTTVTDTQGNPITGLALNFESTNPIDLTATTTGSITTTYPGVAAVTALCEPPACNPAPINVLGLNGTGLPITSNPVDIIVPGVTSDFAWFAAPGQSQYVYSVEVLTGTPGSTVRLPYVPNSMVMDQKGANLYFGSPRELMAYSTQSNSISKQDSTVPGLVLAVAPNGNTLVISDPIRGVLYLYSTLSGTYSSFAGLGAAAAWTPDSNTVYIVDSAALGGNHTNTLYVHNTATGWSSYDLTASGGAQNLAITVPAIGAYLAGNPTVAHTWCPSGTVGNNASILFYPQPDTDSINIATNVLGATTDGEHILGASLNGASISLDDIAVNIPPSLQYPAAECSETTAGAAQTLAPLSTNPSLNGTVNLSQVTDAAAVNQIVTGEAPATASVTTAAPIVFITYNTPSTATTAAQLPYYLPQSTSGVVGPVGYVSFADASSATPPTAPLAGAFSPDNSIFFVSTAGDNEIHLITIPTNVSTSSPPTDSQQISPGLPACTPPSAGGNDAGCLYPTAPSPTTVVPATAIAVKPRSVT